MVDSPEVNERTEWEKESIPNEDDLFYRVPADYLKENALHPGVFRESGGYMSADWSKYSTAAETRSRVGIERMPRFGVVKLNVGAVREIEGLEVQHVPLPDNRSHSGIYGIGSGPTRLKRRTLLFLLVNGWEVPPDAVPN